MTPAPRTLPRRAVLAASGTAVLAAAAACSSASTPNATSAVSAAESALSSAKGAVTSAASSAKAAASSAASSVKQEVSSALAPAAETTPAATAPSGTPLASVASVESAKSVVVGEDQNAVLLASSGGTVVAHTAVCTHQGCTIAASGDCPCHNSKFDVTTGAVLNGPAQQPLAEVSVTIFDGQVYKV